MFVIVIVSYSVDYALHILYTLLCVCTIVFDIIVVLLVLSFLHCAHKRSAGILPPPPSDHDYVTIELVNLLFIIFIFYYLTVSGNLKMYNNDIYTYLLEDTYKVERSTILFIFSVVGIYLILFRKYIIIIWLWYVLCFVIVSVC